MARRLATVPIPIIEQKYRSGLILGFANRLTIGLDGCHDPSILREVRQGTRYPCPSCRALDYLPASRQSTMDCACKGVEVTLNQMQRQHLQDVIEIHLQDFFDNLFDDLRDAGRDYDISLND